MMAKRKSKVEADLSHGRLFIQKEVLSSSYSENQPIVVRLSTCINWT